LLRSLSSRSGGLALITAGRHRVAEMNQQTAHLNPHGSPYFNTLSEVRLGAFSYDEAMQALLTYYAPKQAETLLTVTGRHPYFISLATQMPAASPPPAALLKTLASRADAHYQVAFDSLDHLAPVLLGTLGYESLSRTIPRGEVDDLIWRGWLENGPGQKVRPGSLLLDNWLTEHAPQLIHKV